MNEVKNRIFDVLGRVLGFIAANGDLFGKPRPEPPSISVNETRPKKTTTKSTKRLKGASI